MGAAAAPLAPMVVEVGTLKSIVPVPTGNNVRSLLPDPDIPVTDYEAQEFVCAAFSGKFET